MPSVVLVGMPGAGKSTIGVLLAKQLARQFIDTDLLIQLKAKRPLQAIVNEQGYLALRALEEEVLLETDVQDSVVATGGSAVYSQKAMERLKRLGTIVYLQVGSDELKRRLGDFSERGIACDPGTGFEAIYNERCPLYRRYADITVDWVNQSAEEVVEQIVAALNRHP